MSVAIKTDKTVSRSRFCTELGLERLAKQFASLLREPIPDIPYLGSPNYHGPDGGETAYYAKLKRWSNLSHAVHEGRAPIAKIEAMRPAMRDFLSEYVESIDEHWRFDTIYDKIEALNKPIAPEFAPGAFRERVSNEVQIMAKQYGSRFGFGKHLSNRRCAGQFREGHRFIFFKDFVTLQGIDLGMIEIRLYQTHPDADDFENLPLAFSPNPPENHPNIIHPNVCSHSICFGDGERQAESALRGGRITELFDIVSSILHTPPEDDEEVYRPLHIWNMALCNWCGDATDDCCNSCTTPCCPACKMDWGYCQDCEPDCEGDEE